VTSKLLNSLISERGIKVFILIHLLA